MDLTTVMIAILSASVVALGLITYRLIKSLELYLIPLYAEVIRKRERDYVLVDFLTSLLASKGLVTPAEAAALKNIASTGPLTIEDLDRIDEILDKDPTQLSFEEIIDLKKIAYKLLARLDKKSLRLGLKILRFVTRVEEALAGGSKPGLGSAAERMEMSYDNETCTVHLVTYKRDGTVERSQGPDTECVAQTLAVLKALARRKEGINEQLAQKALAKYEKCKNSDAAGCRALNEALGALEKKSLDMLLERRNT
ncbi:hypothetical protein [Pyrobaculum ferrireducens]|uniref:Uncharacterized protein n=1 Tax=Pyrobaculum ferrireducens TaxID=1104324 RepID=G7VG10_9CREN|nr:hypothetical protein [Pyrobaculum ferrireducens]AET33008.1 hypothetical protein P186_1590 [Pyrobaculum ferrireducens]